MVKAVFRFEVEPERQRDFLKVTEDKIKPYWESHGCLSYQVWQVEGSTTFIKEMSFADVASKEQTMNRKDEESDSIRALWRGFIKGFSIETHVRVT
ncbi:MAG: antibiotic biosynthesis monooxygenase [Deltaproteobacteria bacterium]|nr:antibiotic biosynthesis monooxygenase [Deltaproteobacteria bacterium]MBW2138488.1 antibiotic biosynthesis monooxygenase [Deltaproteobacteria bacterium]